MGPLLLAALVGLAFADEAPAEAAPATNVSLRFGPSFGFEGVINDPFLNRNGVRIGFNVAPAPWVEVGTAIAHYPILGHGGESDPDWKPLSKQLLLENSISPDISKLEWQWQTVARVHALRLLLGASWHAGVGVIAGVTVVSTQDDLVALQRDDEFAMATQNQLHVGPVVGVFWEARRDRLTLRVRYERDAFIETISSSTLELKQNGVLGAELMWWFG